MFRAAGNLFVALAVIVGIAAVVLSSPSREARGQDKKDKKDKIDPSKLKPDPKLVAAQKKAIEGYWKDVFEMDKAPLAETAHFLVVGGKPGTDPATLGTQLEQQYATACKVLQREQDPAPWQGKLAVYLLPDSKKFPHMIRLLERRNADEDDIGTWDSQGMFPHVVACTGKLPGDMGLVNNAGAQMAAAVLNARAEVLLPGWLNQGFGRATVLHSGPPAALAAERRKAAALLAKNARSLDDVFGSNLGALEQPILRGSLVDYLAYSGQTSKFLPFIEGFRPDEKGNGGNLDTAFKNANTTREQLQNNWHKFAKAFK